MAHINTGSESRDLSEERILEGTLVGDEIHVQPLESTTSTGEGTRSQDQTSEAEINLAVGSFACVVFGGGMRFLASEIRESHPKLAVCADVVGGAALLGAGIMGWTAHQLATNSR